MRSADTSHCTDDGEEEESLSVPFFVSPKQAIRPVRDKLLEKLQKVLKEKCFSNTGLE